jgi:sugar phosphate permease
VFSVLAAFPQLLINSSTPEESSIYIHDTEGTAIPAQVMVSIIAAGFLVGGVTNVLSAAVCAKIGGHGATSRVTGVIDGIGSLGASATQIIIPLIGVGSGWDAIFWLLAGLLVLSAVTLVRIIKDESRNS